MQKLKIERNDETIAAIRRMRIEEGLSLRKMGDRMGVTGQQILNVFGDDLRDLPSVWTKKREDKAATQEAVHDYILANAPVVRADVLEHFGLTESQFARFNVPRDAILWTPKPAVKVWSDEAMLASLRTAHAELGGELTVKRYREWASEQETLTVVSVAGVVSRFGSWRKGCQDAGVPTGRTIRQDYAPRWDYDDCLGIVADYVENCLVLSIKPTFVGYESEQQQRDEWPSGTRLRQITGVPWSSMIRLSQDNERK